LGKSGLKGMGKYFAGGNYFLEVGIEKVFGKGPTRGCPEFGWAGGIPF